ncbi:MAG: hypothetical protein K2Y21_08985 [Phycisphaerales bacterium]|nr:hypothetical protein [Phycisphaerales bacterium]
MIWSSFAAASAGLPGSTSSMYNGDVATVSVLGTLATFAPFGTHSFGGPIYDAVVDLAPFNIELAPLTTYIIGLAVFNAGDCGIMETAQTGTSDRGLSPYYSSTGWRWMNSFEGLNTGRYAVALSMTPACPADLNNDDQVDDADFVIFAAAYNTLDCADPVMAAGCPADLNIDGFVNDADFVSFATAYNELVCPGPGPHQILPAPHHRRAANRHGPGRQSP